MRSHEAPVLFDQLTFKSLLHDHKEETPDKGIQERSSENTPILSLAVDALVQSPDADLADQQRLRFHISDFELKHLERRVAGDLFSSAKKKYSCNFDGLTLDTTCSNSFEVVEEPKPLAIFDQIFGDSNQKFALIKPFETCLDSPDDSPPTTTRESQTPSAEHKPCRMRLADYVDQDEVSNNLISVVELLKSQLEQRYSNLAATSCSGNPLKAAKRKTEGRFSLF